MVVRIIHPLDPAVRSPRPGVRIDSPGGYIPAFMASLFPELPEDGEWLKDDDPTGIEVIGYPGTIAPRIVPASPSVPAVVRSPWFDIGGAGNRRVFVYVEHTEGLVCYNDPSDPWFDMTIDVLNGASPGQQVTPINRVNSPVSTAGSTTRSGVLSLTTNSSVTAQYGTDTGTGYFAGGAVPAGGPTVNCVSPPLGVRAMWYQQTQTSAWATGSLPRTMRLTLTVRRAVTLGRIGFGYGPG